MLYQATKFVTSLLTENEELRKFPKEFVDASVKWIRTWFLKDDPVMEAVLVSKGNYDLKAKVVAARLPLLEKDEQFMKELGRRMADYERMKNVILNSKVDVKGNADIGDKGKDGDDGRFGTKNAILGSEVTVSGSMTLGDHHQTQIGTVHTGSGDIVQGNKTITNNNFYGAPGKNPHPDKSKIKALAQEWIAKGDLETAIVEVVDYMDTNNHRAHNEALQLSGRYHALKNRENRGILSDEVISLEQNRIRASLVSLLSEL